LVGHIASEWAHLEHILDEIIWNLSKIDQKKGACVTAQLMGTGPRCRAIVSLCTISGIDDEMIAKVRSFMGSCERASEHRHRIVHDPWYVDTGTQKPAQFKSMPFRGIKTSGPQYGITEADAAQIDKTLNDVRELVSEATTLKSAISAAGKNG